MSETTTIHVFTEGQQPATEFKVDFGSDEEHIIKNKPRALARCYGCRKLRRCENMTVQAFYDGPRYWCNSGGCKGTKNNR